MTAPPPEIKEFKSLIEPYLNGAKVVSHETSYLTKPGENYGAVVLKITVDVEETNGARQTLHVIGKLPPINDFLWKIFQPEITFEKENRCYTHLTVELKKLQKEANVPEEDVIDVLPKCYGARISLDPKSKYADKDAALLMENLNVAGYRMVDRIKGFTFDQTLVVLRNLAKFHALPIAMQMKKPDLFDSTFRPYLTRFNPDEGLNPKELDDLIKTAASDLQVAGYSKKFVNYALELIDIYYKYMNDKTASPKSIYTTVIHCDLWANNMLIKEDSSGKPTNVKFVDFQIVQYDSLVQDLLFFLFSSVQVHILQKDLDQLLDYYFDNFLRCLQQVGCSTSPYTKESFLEEIRKQAAIQYIHVLLMLRVVYIQKDTLNDFREINNDAFTVSAIDDSLYVTLKIVTEIFQKRNWIKTF